MLNLTPAYLHLLLNHFPIILSLTGSCLLAIAIFYRHPVFVRTALMVVVASGIFAVAANLTGEGAEEFAERDTAISHSAIEKHEDAASTATPVWVGGAVVALFLLALTFRRRPIPVWLPLLAASISVAGSGLGVYTGKTGGSIRHQQTDMGQVSNEENKEEVHHDID